MLAINSRALSEVTNSKKGRLNPSTSGDEGVGGGDGGDDVLDHSQCLKVGHSLDVEHLRPLERLLEDPSHIRGTVLIQLLCRESLIPLDHVGVGDAVLGDARRGGDGAHGEGFLGWKEVERALEAGGALRKDKSRLAHESLGASVYKGNDRLWKELSLLVAGHKTHQKRVQPSPRLNIVETRDDH